MAILSKLFFYAKDGRVIYLLRFSVGTFVFLPCGQASLPPPEHRRWGYIYNMYIIYILTITAQQQYYRKLVDNLHGDEYSTCTAYYWRTGLLFVVDRH